MPRNSRTRKTSRRRIIGRGKVWDWIKKAHGWIRDNKVISRVAGLIPHPYAQTISKGASVLGYGRRRVKSRRGCGCR